MGGGGRWRVSTEPSVSRASKCLWFRGEGTARASETEAAAGTALPIIPAMDMALFWFGRHIYLGQPLAKRKAQREDLPSLFSHPDAPSPWAGWRGGPVGPPKRGSSDGAWLPS